MKAKWGREWDGNIINKKLSERQLNFKAGGQKNWSFLSHKWISLSCCCDRGSGALNDYKPMCLCAATISWCLTPFNMLWQMCFCSSLQIAVNSPNISEYTTVGKNIAGIYFIYCRDYCAQCLHFFFVAGSNPNAWPCPKTLMLFSLSLAHCIILYRDFRPYFVLWHNNGIVTNG